MWLSLTSDQPWEPYDEVLNESEKEAREKRELSCSAITTIEKNSITITMLNDHILKLVKSSNQQSIITPSDLCRKWVIVANTAMRTRYRITHQQLKYKQLSNPHGQFYSDTMFYQHVGIPSMIVTDGAKALTLGNWKSVIHKHHIPTCKTEPYSPWQRWAESAI
jgi:hypothetical protein